MAVRKRKEAEAWGVNVGGRNGINHAEKAVAARTLGLSESSALPPRDLSAATVAAERGRRRRIERGFLPTGPTSSVPWTHFTPLQPSPCSILQQRHESANTPPPKTAAVPLPPCFPRRPQPTFLPSQAHTITSTGATYARTK
ncbi:hypothetical protein SRHO_G00317460 [Serrasalmus rhombeus]